MEMGCLQLVLEKSQCILDFPTYLLGKADRGAQTEATSCERDRAMEAVKTDDGHLEWKEKGSQIAGNGAVFLFFHSFKVISVGRCWAGAQERKGPRLP